MAQALKAFGGSEEIAMIGDVAACQKFLEHFIVIEKKTEIASSLEKARAIIEALEKEPSAKTSQNRLQRFREDSFAALDGIDLHAEIVTEENMITPASICICCFRPATKISETASHEKVRICDDLACGQRVSDSTDLAALWGSVVR